MDYMPLPKSGRLWKSKADFFRPFRAAASGSGQNITPLYDPLQRRVADDEPKLKELNASLAVLVEVFPDVEPEVFREMLLNVSEESRLELVVEAMRKKKAEHVRGLHRRKTKPTTTPKAVNPGQPLSASSLELLIEDTFRSETYIKAVRQVLYEEFPRLSHSSIKAVMAEQNHSYTLSRSTLQHLSSRAWRLSFPQLWRSRSTSRPVAEHPFVFMHPNGQLAVKRTGSEQLDRELYDLLIAPAIAKQRREQLEQDTIVATKLNQEEAEKAQALFDCECCFDSVPFEELAVCTDGCHQLCFECVRRTVNEALYGQGWARTVDLERSSVRCFAPTAREECHGPVPADIVRRALISSRGDEDTWNKFQARAANDILVKSRLPLQRCPSCNYAEIDEIPPFKCRRALEIWQHIATRSPAALQIMLLSLTAGLVLFTIPIIAFLASIWLTSIIYSPITNILRASHTRIHQSRRGLKFICLSPTCLTITCTRCLHPWTDPHTCFSSSASTTLTTLRTTLEASATAAIKRTCPRCQLSFIKSSGCNKLVCNCGYTMCYVCRSEIPSREGYGHFCQHFRPNGGRCGECEKCELYGDEDEAGVIRRAVEQAEEEWRVRKGEGVEGTGGNDRARKAMVEALVGKGRERKVWWESWLDGAVDAVAG
ncbi:hypothetical protein BAUCODRAFT_36809 [Baudoinia panamericana UAMH 10762]|uniref:RING-type domain-containing protein n=1 Tax=Baudoinia panamericana (strain UAMH 10762) TaxID=717646 RepID=M2MNW2_BAUPA|nr:uncharacterized protein BAUCODRAFT_36809 [Baudoinia panamericana UAMH 10762]EMC93138.1 hypothetical protein BAUCODRAFT_36809 [Baudoinia panamericana UAMH 10762]